MSDNQDAMSENQERKSTLTVFHSRDASDFALVQENLVGSDAAVANLFLRFADETAAARGDETRLRELISEFTFHAFPQATNQVVALRSPDSDRLDVIVSRSRTGGKPFIQLSSTLVERVMNEDVAILFSVEDATETSSQSLVISNIRTAICAPLRGVEETFGVIQLDIRNTAKGLFSKKDLDRITVFAHHIALVLDGLRTAQEQRRALKSTINALVHSLYLKDPDTAEHSERVQKVSVWLGQEFGLGGDDLEALGIAALLHDVGKQGVRDRVLKKSGKYDDRERREMSHHTRMSETILDMIYYPPALKDVPLYAAYHHEKMNGSGPYKLKGDEIPLPARIISVADAFDALISPRVYKDPKPPEDVLAILERGRGQVWDDKVLDALRETLPGVLKSIYGHLESPASDSPSIESEAA